MAVASPGHSYNLRSRSRPRDDRNLRQCAIVEGVTPTGETLVQEVIMIVNCIEIYRANVMCFEILACVLHHQ